MSRLRELIDELCPDGVEYKALNELFDIRNGYTPSKKNPAFWTDGVHPWFVMEDIRRDGTVLTESAAHITDAALKKNGLFPANSIIVATSATIGVHALVTVDFLCNQRFACMSIKRAYAGKLDIRYVHQAFFTLDRWCLDHVDQGNFATVNGAALKAYRIPVPPIEVQREIVRILDSFQELDDALTAEIEARENQIEYCRSKIIDSVPERHRLPLGSVADVFDGVHKTPTYTDSGIRFVSVENIGNLHGSKKYISKDAFEKNYRTSPICGDVLMTRIGTIGKCALVDDVEPLAYYVSLSLIRPHAGVLEPSYLRHVLESRLGRVELRRRTIDTAVPMKINLGEIGKLSIPVPSLSEQQCIQSRLDEMLLLVDTLKEELDARRKQFEYYRDRLLAFPEKVS